MIRGKEYFLRTQMKAVKERRLLHEVKSLCTLGLREEEKGQRNKLLCSVLKDILNILQTEVEKIPLVKKNTLKRKQPASCNQYSF